MASTGAARRRCDHRRLRKHRSYTVAEAAERLGIHQNTVRHHMKRGLPYVETRAGALILGEAAQAYFSKRKAGAKSPCPPGAMFCLRCRVPRRPPPELIELIQIEGRPPNLRGLCPECGALMHRRVGKAGPAAAGFPTASHG
jgi:hypothetical protein